METWDYMQHAEAEKQKEASFAEFAAEANAKSGGQPFRVLSRLEDLQTNGLWKPSAQGPIYPQEAQVPHNPPGSLNQPMTVDDMGPVFGRLVALETGLVNGSAGWAVDLQNLENKSNHHKVNPLDYYYKTKDELSRKYPGFYLSGDLIGTVGSGFLYGAPAMAESAAAKAASRGVAAEVAESLGGRQFGKQVFRGASVAERAAVDEAAAAELDDVARGLGGSYTKGGQAGAMPPNMVSPYDLKPTHGRTLSNKKYNLLKEQIKNDGIQEPIKYVEYNGTKYIVDGHHRILAAKELGIKAVPIEKVDLPYLGYRDIYDLWLSE